MARQKKQLLLYIIGSIVFLAIPFINSAPYHSDEDKFISFNSIPKQDLLRYALLLIFFYINYFLLIPRLYFAQKYFIYFVLLLVIMYLIALLPQMFAHGEAFGGRPFHNGPFETSASAAPGSHSMYMHPPGNMRNKNFFLERFDHNLFLFFAVAFFSLLIRISNRWKQTEKEKTTAELSYLKAQINPHFLFNTLNSIYSLAIQKADSTAEAVQKLSTMMRYVLSESESQFVQLRKELDYISNYIALQKLRFGTELKMDYQVAGNTENKMIAPLILIPFIENCFKYGVNAEEDTDIRIQINIQENKFEMIAGNKIVTVQPNEENQHGIGLENTKARLNLIYPSKHELLIEKSDKKFSVKLTIHLT